ncbi:MAG: hypothetical protein EXS17_04175 [Phycisphaerales bacterium]|nr:hypothetical protein [Phycisphaerales bacterium]
MKHSSITVVVTLAASLVIAGCEDPTIAQRDAAQAKINQAAESIALAAQRASLDRVAAAEDLRAAGRTAQSISNASDAQQQAAAGLVATATTQAALLELARAAQLESANRASRSLALALTRVADDMSLLLESQKENGLDASAAALTQVQTLASAQSTALSAAHGSIEADVAALKARHDEALAQAQELLIAAEDLRQTGLSAGRGQIMVIAQQAGEKRDEARVMQTQASQSSVDAAARQVELRLAAGVAQSASRQAAAISNALTSIQAMQSSFDKTAAQGTEVISNLRETIETLRTATDSREHPELTGCYERALADLESAESSARRSGTAASAVNTVLSTRARALLSRGEGEFQTALLLNSLSGSPSMAAASNALGDDAQKALTKAQASTKEALEVYAALKEALANGSGNNAAVTALQATIDRVVTKLKVPTFEISAEDISADADAKKSATKSAKKSASSVRPDSEGAATSAGPPCASADALVAFISSLSTQPANALRIDECLIAKTAGGKALQAALFAAPKAMATLQNAMKAKFQMDDLGPISAMGAQSIAASAADVTANSATISVGGAQGSLPFQAVNVDGDWKLDLDATADAMAGAMLMQITMMGKMVGGLINSINEITKNLESGELDSLAATQEALTAAMQSLMSGMTGGAPSPDGN